MAGLVEAGAVDGRSVAGAVDGVDLVLLSLPGGPELETVVAGDGGVLSVVAPGQLVVDHTTAPLGLTRRLADRCRERGVGWCDAPIARTRQAAIDGTLSIMVGGDPDDVSRVEPVLRTMATDVTRCGGVGSGQVTKLLNNMVLFQNVRAVAEAHAIACGLDSTHGPDLGLDIDNGLRRHRRRLGGQLRPRQPRPEGDPAGRLPDPGLPDELRPQGPELRAGAGG